MMVNHSTQVGVAAASKAFRFRDLPAEIRKKIYTLVLANDGSGGAPHVYLEDQGVWRKQGYHRRHPFSGAVVRVCRQLHNEAVPVLYATTTFHSDDEKSLLAFLRRSPAAKYNLRDISIDRIKSKRHFTSALHLLKHARAFESLFLGWRMELCQAPDWHKFEKMLPWLQAMQERLMAKAQTSSALDLVIFDHDPCYILPGSAYVCNDGIVAPHEQKWRAKMRRGLGQE